MEGSLQNLINALSLRQLCFLEAFGNLRFFFSFLVILSFSLDLNHTCLYVLKRKEENSIVLMTNPILIVLKKEFILSVKSKIRWTRAQFPQMTSYSFNNNKSRLKLIFFLIFNLKNKRLSRSDISLAERNTITIDDRF